MTETPSEMPEPVTGRVKWFDPSKGFGFVVADAGGPDILLHANVLRNYGQSSVADGAAVTLRVQRTPRGLQAVEIVTIVPVETELRAPILEDVVPVDAATLAATPMQPARVKWFDKGKGFGFGNVFGRPEDVFIHIEVLRRSGLADLQPGEAVALRVVDGDRGKLAISVGPWESALADVSQD